MTSFQWNRRQIAILLLILFILSAGVILYIAYLPFQYLVNTGLSLINRQEPMGIARFIYKYGSYAPGITVLLNFAVIVSPNLKLLPVIKAASQVLGPGRSLVFSLAGTLLGSILIIVSARIVLCTLLRNNIGHFGKGSLATIVMLFFSICTILVAPPFPLLFFLLMGISHIPINMMIRTLVAGQFLGIIYILFMTSI